MFEAIQSLSMAIPKYSDNKDLYAVRASLYLEQGQPAAALQDLQMALKLDPEDPALLTNRAQVYRQFGQIREALIDLNKAINLSPNLLAARFNRGAIYYSSEDYQLALEDFDQCVAIDPHVAGPYFNRASTKQELGDTVGAKNDLNRFIQLSDSEQWKSTAQDLLQRWEKDEARKQLKHQKVMTRIRSKYRLAVLLLLSAFVFALVIVPVNASETVYTFQQLLDDASLSLHEPAWLHQERT